MIGRSNHYRIGLDFTTLDHLHPGAGQYRFVIDLVRGLAAVKSPFQFVLFGSKPEPVPELREVVGSGKPIAYRFLRRQSFRGSYYLSHLRYAVAIWNERLDLWHTFHTFIPAFCPCRVVATQYDLMMELFDEYREAINSRPYRIYHSLLRRGNFAVICISETTRADLIRLKNIDPDRSTTIMLGTGMMRPATDAEAEGLFHRYPQLRGSQWLVSPYNLEPRKNLRGLLLAFAATLRELPELQLVLFGRAAWTAAREAEFHATLDELGISNRVLLTGYLDDDMLRVLYRECATFVFPSFYEGFGLPILEAMAQSACVVVRNAGAMQEIVGQAGVLTDVTNPSLLSREILALLTDHARRRRLGEAAAERAQSFSVERMTEQTVRVYEDVLHGRDLKNDIELQI